MLPSFENTSKLLFYGVVIHWQQIRFSTFSTCLVSLSILYARPQLEVTSFSKCAVEGNIPNSIPKCVLCSKTNLVRMVSFASTRLRCWFFFQACFWRKAKLPIQCINSLDGFLFTYHNYWFHVRRSLNLEHNVLLKWQKLLADVLFVVRTTYYRNICHPKLSKLFVADQLNFKRKCISVFLIQRHAILTVCQWDHPCHS